VDDVEIPHYIDSQPQIFFWELDEFAPVIFFMGIGIATDTLTAWIPIIIISPTRSSGLRRRRWKAS